MTELHGGVYHQTSTPHKSGNKMKRKKSMEMTMIKWTCGVFLRKIVQHRTAKKNGCGGNENVNIEVIRTH